LNKFSLKKEASNDDMLSKNFLCNTFNTKLSKKMSLEKRKNIKNNSFTNHCSRIKNQKENNNDHFNFINEINSTWIDNLMVEFSGKEHKKKSYEIPEKNNKKEIEKESSIPKTSRIFFFMNLIFVCL
jgi:hypothetical protein